MASVVVVDVGLDTAMAVVDVPLVEVALVVVALVVVVVGMADVVVVSCGTFFKLKKTYAKATTAKSMTTPTAR